MFLVFIKTTTEQEEPHLRVTSRVSHLRFNDGFKPHLRTFTALRHLDTLGVWNNASTCDGFCVKKCCQLQLSNHLHHHGHSHQHHHITTLLSSSPSPSSTQSAVSSSQPLYTTFLSSSVSPSPAQWSSSSPSSSFISSSSHRGRDAGDATAKAHLHKYRCLYTVV